MAGNDYINGVNWSTMKKIARFVFGADNCVNFRKVNRATYIIYLDKEYYYNEKSERLIQKYREYWKVEIKPID